jgi:hypothetical protein
VSVPAFLPGSVMTALPAELSVALPLPAFGPTIE